MNPQQGAAILSSLKRRMQRQHGGPAKNSAVVAIKSSAHFKKVVVDAELPVLVDFWAPWCQPCLMQAPVFAQVAQELRGRACFAKVDTEALPALAQRFGIRSIPSLLLFDGGEVKDVRIGLSSRADLLAMAERARGRGEGVTLGQRLGRLFGASSATAGDSEG